MESNASYSEDDSLILKSSSVSDNDQRCLDISDIVDATFNESTVAETTNLVSPECDDIGIGIRNKKLWRHKVAVIESDSEKDSDHDSFSDEESQYSKSTQIISDSGSLLIVSTDSESEKIDDNQHSKISETHQESASLNRIENKFDSKKENECFDNVSESDFQQNEQNESPEIKNEAASCKSLENKSNVTSAEYNHQSEKVLLLKKNLSTLKASIASIDLKSLKDNGKGLIDRKKQISELLEEELIKLGNMKINEVPKPLATTAGVTAVPTWAELQRDVALVQPHTFGKQALKTVDTQRAMTMEGLRNLHSSLEERPAEDVLADTPSQCTVQLMEHQRHALAFMMWREKKQPSGGLLADDMGLGKTLTVISLCLATLVETREAQKSKEWKRKDKPIRSAGVLVVCPASVMGQWVHEVQKRVKKNTFDVLEYHGTNRHQDVRLLHRVDIVLTTYATLSREHAGNTQIYQLKWRRVVLDEAHQVRNYKTHASEAVCALRAQSRWALTGTPVQNQEIDMFGLMKYLHCEPFDDIAVWKRWVGNKRTGGSERLQSALQALMLRRTKADMIASGALCTFPERDLETIQVVMDRDELLVYNRLMVFSRTLFAQFLQQRAAKHGLFEDTKKYDKVRRNVLQINKFKEVKQSHILVLLLRLRQICIHPALMVKMLETTDIETVVTEEPGDGHNEMLDVLDQLNKLKLREDEHDDAINPTTTDQLTFNDAVKSVFSKEHPVFDTTRQSSKIRACLDLLKERILPTGNKAIIVSQWTSLLKLIAEHLKTDDIQYSCLDGTVKIQDRQNLIDQLNSPKHPCKIMLLSLTAGGVGLNLMGANHLLILDPHWNPQLELQAQDRIYRVGQEKKVHIYRLLATNSIEERIIDLQKKKLEIAHAMLTGGAIVTGNKLTLDDLKMLFNM